MNCYFSCFLRISSSSWNVPYATIWKHKHKHAKKVWPEQNYRNIKQKRERERVHGWRVQICILLQVICNIWILFKLYQDFSDSRSIIPFHTFNIFLQDQQLSTIIHNSSIRNIKQTILHQKNEICGYISTFFWPCCQEIGFFQSKAINITF